MPPLVAIREKSGAGSPTANRSSAIPASYHRTRIQLQCTEIDLESRHPDVKRVRVSAAMMTAVFAPACAACNLSEWDVSSMRGKDEPVSRQYGPAALLLRRTRQPVLLLRAIEQ